MFMNSLEYFLVVCPEIVNETISNSVVNKVFNRNFFYKDAQYFLPNKLENEIDIVSFLL